jgi:UDP-N-acetylmuramoyl-L-alanyl-D-glutamate--2,6-diaminopimelate ligase
LSSQNLTAAEIADALGAAITGPTDTVVSDVTHDSRQARAGTLFAAIQGLTMDGHRFVEDVMRRGAAGIISKRAPEEGFEGLWLQVKDTRKALADAAAFIHHYPSREIDLVGITGTNGKTTTTYLILAMAEANHKRAAMLTTVEYRIGKESKPAVRTTPESSDTQRFLREAISKDCEVAVMEASSQAIHLRRCDNLEYSVAVFTNLTRDHLDYHHTMENYFAAKKELFDGSIGTHPKSSVINIDDEWGVRLLSELKASGQRVVSCSQHSKADFAADNITVSLIKGTNFDLKTPHGNINVSSPLVGRPHVYNMLSAAAVGLELGYDLKLIAKGFETCVGAPGRFERVPHGRDFAVIVDYAHSDDALLNTLRTAADLAEGRIITVFGCGRSFANNR